MKEIINRKIEDRKTIEEHLRKEAYTVLTEISTYHEYSNDTEIALWQTIHDSLCALASYYEANKLKINKH